MSSTSTPCCIRTGCWKPFALCLFVPHSTLLAISALRRLSSGGRSRIEPVVPEPSLPLLWIAGHRRGQGLAEGQHLRKAAGG